MFGMIKCYRDCKTLVLANTIEQLTEGFSYTLQVGNSWKKSVNTQPKSSKALVNNLYKCDMVHGYFNSSYFEMNSKTVKFALSCIQLTDSELNEISENPSGLWKDIDDETFEKIINCK